MSYRLSLRRGPFDPPPPQEEESSGAIAILGPYSITDATPDLDSGAIIATLPDGVYVLGVSIFVVTSWSGGTELQAFITDPTLTDWSDPLAIVAEVTHLAENASFIQESYNGARAQIPAVADSEIPLVRTKIGARLVALATGAPSDGSADYYVVVAEAA